jgi:hypothetical protein
VQVRRLALHGNAKQIVNMHSAVLPQTRAREMPQNGSKVTLRVTPCNQASC